ncbi:MAG: multicopper oxidase domain-containing protein [Deltaproteobacteria bacterium]|nr:multicopper oxidase domain-containing protein [Deltaproteobacteria bacterium]
MERAETSTDRLSRLRHRFGFAAVLTLGVVGWEYLLNAIMNPGVDWSPVGVASHMTLDIIFFVPVVVLALGLGLRWAKRLDLDLRDSAGLLGTAGVVCFLVMAMALPLTSSRDMAHEWVGQQYGLALAEVQTTVVTSDLTVQESTQLCSFGSLRNPSLARDGYQLYAQTLMARAAAGFEDVLVQQAAFLPLLIVSFFLYSRRRASSFGLAPAAALWRLKPVRFGLALLLVGALAFAFSSGSGVNQWNAAEAGIQSGGFNACTDGGEVKEYNVSAIDVTMTLNRWGDHVKGAAMYALDANIPAIIAAQEALDRDREAPEGPGVARVSLGLRKDLIQPLVIRANLGDCLRINFTNAIDDDRPASMHILGLPHSVTNAGSAVGNNPDTFAAHGETVTYEIPMPLDPDAERAYYFHDHGAGRQRQNMGLFGAIVAEPRGATYLDVETGAPLDTVTGSNWEAIIVDPNLDNRPDGKSFREFIIMYHEIGDEGFTDLRDREDKKLPLIDDIAGVYRPAARAINYRSEPFRRRMELDKAINGDQSGHGKSLGYSSYPFGDPPTPIPRSYVGEGVKTRVMHGGSEVFHVHHLHGGGDRWRRNPNADPNNDFWKGLTKVPDPNLTSIHLDSQSIGPGTSYNLEHECGAGGCQQSVGDFLFHCHIGHHYIAGMWSFWRVFGTTQTAETNVNGVPLAAVPDLFQSESPLMEATPPADGVSAGGLLGLVVDGGRVLSTGPTTDSTKNLEAWISEMLPPPGVPLDNSDATVWNWVSTGSGDTLQIWGEPEISEPFPGYIPDTPGERPEVLFNPKNGRYVWPLFRPQPAQRPPFTARHSGAPWLGEEMKEGRLDGLCAVNGVGGVDLGPAPAQKRFYPVSSITLPIQVSPDRQDPDGMIFVLNEEEQAIRNGSKAVEPLAIRSNVGDCVEILFTNQIPDRPINKNFSKVNIHSHFVQFDPQASDGVITGFSYEQSVRPFANEDRRLTAPATAGATTLAVNHTDRLREGIWLGIGLGEGTCGTTAQGQPERCTEIRKITDLTATSITLDQPLSKNHGSGEAVGVEFVRYHWFSDVDFGTVFYHQHVEFKDWDHGLFGTHIVEPKGSTYHDPVTGAPVRAGTLVDIRVDPSAGGNPVASGVEGSFREFMLFLHNNNPVEGRFTRGGSTINLRAEPWRLREGDSAYRFSSVMHGDPHTQTVKAYVGDPVVVRGVGLVERVGGIRFTGHRFNSERYTDASDTRDAQFIGISERFDVSLEGGAGGTGGYPGDYLYYSTLGKDFESGGWGILRAHDTAQPDLQPLPGRTPSGGAGFPQLGETGSAPPRLFAGTDNACPANVPMREYSLVIDDSEVIYNELSASDRAGVVYRENRKPSKKARTPIVMRVNNGECLVVKLRNLRDVRSSISLGELVFDPQRSYGSAIGYNYDSTIPARSGRTYRYYADRELGIVVGLNLADIDSVERGAFAGVVVEPEGSTYTRPGGSGLLPQGGIGVQADVVSGNSEGFREFVALFNDQDRRIGQSAMPYPDRVEKFTGINYSAEPLALRDMGNNPTGVFKTSLWGDPRHVVTVPAGTPLRYRVSQPWGNQMHVPTLEGHRYYLEPGMPGSEQVFNDVLGPGMSIDMHVVGGAGGDISAPGDYLFLDRRQPFMEAGLWNILRVTEDGSSGGGDRVRVREMNQLANATGGSSLSIKGTVSPRPAGDTVPYVTIHEGAQTAAGCRGKVLARVPVDPGSGEWELEAELAGSPGRICVQSPAGGALEGLASR